MASGDIYVPHRDTITQQAWVTVFQNGTNTVLTEFNCAGLGYYLGLHCAMSTDGSAFVMRGSLGIAIIDTATNTFRIITGTGYPDSGSYGGIAVSSTGTYIYIVRGTDGVPCKVRASDGVTVATGPATTNPAADIIAVSFDDSRVFYGSPLKAYSTADMSLLWTSVYGGSPRTFSCDGSKVYLYTTSNNVVAVNAATGLVAIAPYVGTAGISDFCISPDGTTIYAAEGTGITFLNASDLSLIAKASCGLGGSYIPDRVATYSDGSKILFSDCDGIFDDAVHTMLPLSPYTVGLFKDFTGDGHGNGAGGYGARPPQAPCGTFPPITPVPPDPCACNWTPGAVCAGTVYAGAAAPTTAWGGGVVLATTWVKVGC